MSRHSLHELEIAAAKFGEAALDLARKHPVLPYFPIGHIDELLGSIEELAGSFDDMRANDELRDRLGSLAKSGTDIRDRGGLIDALRAGADVFVTYDRAMVADAPRGRIEQALAIRVRTPEELLHDVGALLTGAG